METNKEDMAQMIDLPYAPDAEAAFLVSAIESPRRIGKVILEQGITSDLFHDQGHEQLMALILHRLREAKPIDPSSLREDIRKQKPKFLSLAKLTKILNQEYDEDAHEGYISAMRHTKAKRLILEATDGLDDMSGHDAVSAMKRASEAAQMTLHGSTDIYDAKRAVTEFLAAMKSRFEDESASGAPTGIEQIDQHTGGMRAGELWVIGAKTSGGKSVLMLQMAAKAVKDGKKVLVFSLEMGVDEVVARMVSNMGKIEMDHIMTPKSLNKGDQMKITTQATILKDSSLSICDTAGLSMDQITGHALRQKETSGLDLVIIDYLQMVSARHVKGQNREQEVAGISRACKQLAKKLKCPVITATQLNEQGQSRESRAIEHDADNVLLIQDADSGVNVTFWKCRNGERGKSFEARLNGRFQRFDFNPRY
jgi:replicative DNA helicase